MRSAYSSRPQTSSPDRTVQPRSSFPSDFELLLASQSPRRHSLLRDLGVPFRVVSSQAEERLQGGEASVLAEANALTKVRQAVLPADVCPGAYVLGTDTLVALGSRVMGKPSTAEEAAQMLRLLSGRRHQVVSGVALARGTSEWPPRVAAAHEGGGGRPQGLRAAVAVTDVTFLSLSEADIQAYLALGEWKGKAGAYGIQGSAGLFVAGIWGEYSNVVGLPLCLLARMFRESGFDLLGGSWS